MSQPEFNPYASPLSVPAPMPGSVAPTGQIWREGSVLVMTKDAVLPDRCVKCNQPAHGRRLKRSLSWHHPVLYILILISLLIYVIIALIIRHTAKIQVGICDHHLSRRRMAIAVGWVLALVGIGIMVAAVNLDIPALIIVATLFFLVGLLYGIIGSRVVTPKRIDKHYVWLKGIDQNYLHQSPEIMPGR